jgi:hypothetical protein
MESVLACGLIARVSWTAYTVAETGELQPMRSARGGAIAGYVGLVVGRIPLAPTAETLGRDR